MKLAKRGAIAVLTLACLLAPGIPAYAADDQPDQLPPLTLTEEKRSELLDRLDSWNVAPDQAADLVESLESGEKWDSQTDAEPVSVSHEVRDGLDYTISRWADGSFVAAGIEQPQSLSARSISGCSSSGTSAGVSYRTNCLIRVDSGSTSGEFRASYSYWATGSSIYDVGAQFINYDIGSASPGGFSSSTAPGTKWTQFNWTTSVDGWGTLSRYVRLTVSTGGGSSSANY